jgi:hypothetical protein
VVDATGQTVLAYPGRAPANTLDRNVSDKPLTLTCQKSQPQVSKKCVARKLH